MRERIYQMRDWHFSEQFEERMIKEPIGEDAKSVTLPHTVKELPFNYFDEKLYQIVSAYQRMIFADPSWEGRIVRLTFEAVGHEAVVYLNGEEVARHACGYTAFTVDLTEKLHYGEENLLTVRVDSNETLDVPPFGFVIDYMTYGGIYRDVYLEILDPIHIEDLFIKPSLASGVTTSGLTKEEIEGLTASGILVSEVTFSEAAEAARTSGDLMLRQWIEEESIVQGPAEKEIRATVADISLWDVESPHVYTITTQLYLSGDAKILDEVKTTVGFRAAEFRTDGFYLNGRKVKIRGLNRHQSYAYVGYAMPESMQRYDAKILKHELALNAVRTSHYPQSQYFMDACDREGLLVFTEMPGWQHIGDDAWKEQAYENIREMITQYRNHPSIILWGVRINESQDDDVFYQKTNEIAHALDATRPTGGVRAMKKSHLFEDVYTYNDFVHSGANVGCEPKAKVTSDASKPYLISEYNGHMYPTKMFDDEEHRREHMIRHANVLDAVAAEEDIAGSFGWCMFDYNTHKDFGSGDRICYHGVMDLFRNPKPAAAIYAAQGEESPVLELSSSMDIGEHPACNRDDTYIISNADAVRMYKNNILIKEYTNASSTHPHLAHGPILIDDYVGDALVKGEGYGKRQAALVKYCLNQVAMHGMKMTPRLVWAALRLVAIYHMNPNDAVAIYNKYVGDWGGESKQYRFDAVKDGRVVRSIIRTPMKEQTLQVVSSARVLREEITYDVCELRIKAVDEYGNQLFYSNEPLAIELSGPIELIGPKAVPLRGGVSGVYIRTTGSSGAASVTISSETFAPVTIDLQVDCAREE